ncbi:MAG TPA: SGNH/GDSL hydrolase family protein [Phnomibacter sp.]|nr:SGNH/GDSL hydrolase family protein [Phnomibacter sp.]
MSRHTISLLCLGDSYTIGEAVSLYDSFPYQLVQLLRKQHLQVHAPEIVAQTGWTSFELADYLIKHAFNDHYDFVTLLIGVNNQYRGLSVEDFAEEFEFLLKKAIHFADNKAQHVCVLSIPDWGVTPFAKGKDATTIEAAIDQFNEVKNTIAAKYGVYFIDITPLTRKAKQQKELIASDGLHPSAMAYTEWAKLVAAWVSKQV